MDMKVLTIQIILHPKIRNFKIDFFINCTNNPSYIDRSVIEYGSLQQSDYNAEKRENKYNQL